MALKQLIRSLNPLAQRFGFYTSYELDSRELVGTTSDHTLFSIEARLRSRGYESPPTVAGIPLSAVKTHPEDGTSHELTLRKVDPDNPRKQWHVHLWERDGVVELYSHYEFMPDLNRVAGETHAERMDRLQEHYRPDYGSTYRMGVADSSAKCLLG